LILYDILWLEQASLILYNREGEKMFGLKVKSWMKFILKMVVIIVIISLFEMNGVIAIVLYIILSSLWAVYLARDQVITIKHYTETAIWGKPLKMFKKGELKNTKVKIVWGKKNDKSKDRRRTN